MSYNSNVVFSLLRFLVIHFIAFWFLHFSSKKRLKHKVLVIGAVCGNLT